MATSRTGASRNCRSRIEHLEFKQQTEVYSTDKERELIEKIKHLKALVKEQEAELEQNKEMRAKLAEARELRRRASEIHKEVTEKAELAQQHHDLMVEAYRKADKSREEADRAHQKFVEAQEARTRSTGCLLPARRNSAITIRLYPVCGRRTRKTKVTREQKAVRKEAERVFQQFRDGEKITTDDLLLLQRAKLI